MSALAYHLAQQLSYRDVEELLGERGVHADHVTVWRWVQRYAPELQRRLRRHLKPTNDSRRMDETYVRVKGKWRYLYRAVDSTGATLDFLLSAKQDAVAAKRFLAKALGGASHPAPRVIITDKHAAYPPAQNFASTTNLQHFRLDRAECTAHLRFRSSRSRQTETWQLSSAGYCNTSIVALFGC
jgi:transposase-like protein